MRGIFGAPLRLGCLLLPVLCAAVVPAQDSYRITPDRSTMLVGEWRSFRMVDQYGHGQQRVTWTISDPDSFESTQADELRLSPRRAGEFRLTARTDFATAEAQVTVLEGSTSPPGAIQWTSGALPGCATTKLIPARKVPHGPDFFEQSHCQDGDYVAAYTSDGVQLWRRKIGESGALSLSSGGNSYETVGTRVDPHAASVCDSVPAGMPQQSVSDLVTARNASIHQEPGSSHAWLVEESGSQCRLWFDEKLTVMKKQRVFIEGFVGGGPPSNAQSQARAGVPVTPVAQAPASAPMTAALESPPPDAPTQTASSAAPPAGKAKHVITNDDIQPSPFTSFGGLFYLSTGSINDCDANCFEQVRTFALVNADKYPHWRDDVLKQLDLLRSDGGWQRYLHQLYDAHNKVCQVTFDKQDEMRRTGNARNLGALEVAIADKYDDKMSAAKAQVAAAESRESEEEKRFADKPFAKGFTTVQTGRMRSGFCSQAKVIYPTLIQ